MTSNEAGSLSDFRGRWGPERACVRRTVKPGKAHKQEIIYHADPDMAFPAADSANQLSEFELQECKDAFSSVPGGERGTVSCDVVPGLITRLELDPGSPEVQDLICEKQGEAGSGELSFREFLCLVSQLRRGRDDEELREAFLLLDSAHTGSIGASEVRQMMASLGHTLTEEEAEGMVREADTSGSGRVSFPDFCRMMKHCS